MYQINVVERKNKAEENRNTQVKYLKIILYTFKGQPLLEIKA